MRVWPDDFVDRFIAGHVLEVLQEIPAESVQCVVTSPPYWGLRDYGLEPIVWQEGDRACEEHEWRQLPPRRNRGPKDACTPKQLSNIGTLHTLPKTNFCLLCGAWRGSLGLEPSPELYTQHIVEIFQGVKRVLRKDGTVWLNLGDSYMGGKGQSGQGSPEYQAARQDVSLNKPHQHIAGPKRTRPTDRKQDALKPKDLCGIPWRVALALQADGWWLRSDIIWSKSNPMPESVRDRPTKSHEYIFLLTKSKKYYYDQDAVREPVAAATLERDKYTRITSGKEGPYAVAHDHETPSNPSGRNLRSVWRMSTQPFPEAHFATYPEKLVERCILAGTRPDDLILDPFMGSGTTACVAVKHGRHFVGIELSEEYCEMARRRIVRTQTELQFAGTIS